MIFDYCSYYIKVYFLWIFLFLFVKKHLQILDKALKSLTIFELLIFKVDNSIKDIFLVCFHESLYTLFCLFCFEEMIPNQQKE